MKKLIITLMLAVVTGGIMAFASGNPVTEKVLESFQKEFPRISEVHWVDGDNFYRADFVMNTQHVSAFFSAEGELMGLTRYISSLQLPLNLMSELKNQYENYWITDLFEVNKDGSTLYYVTIENADLKLMLKAANGTAWSIYKKTRKS